MKDEANSRLHRIEDAIKVRPQHLKELSSLLGEPEHRVRYSLEVLVFQGRAHIGSWAEHVANDGKSRVTAVYHPGPGVAVPPPRGIREPIQSAVGSFNSHSDLTAVMQSWAHTGEHDE